MWLDRLSGHSTPAPTPLASPPSSTKRSYSPGARRSNLAPPISAQRPGFSPRSSSLSLPSSDSTTSLLSSARRPNGSGLKNAASVAEITGPLEVLEKLVGSETRLRSNVSLVNNEDYSDFELDLDFDGLSLKEIATGKLLPYAEESKYTAQSVEECMDFLHWPGTSAKALIVARERNKFEELHQSIQACDSVLSTVELNLTSFQNDLAAVSMEIETLQARSTALSFRLDNRKVVENGLGPIVEEISVSPAVVRKIVDGAIDEAWVRALAEVEKRSKALDTKSKEQRSIKGMEDLRPLLENLVNKVSLTCWVITYLADS
jgi:hypothetical protein